MRDGRLMGRVCSAVLILVIALSGYGCERSGSKTRRGPEQGPGASAGQLSVRLSPEAPGASAEIQAICSCAGDPSTRYRWELNGQSLQDEQGSSLRAMNRFRRGDKVGVYVTASGSTAAASTIIANTPPAVEAVAFRPDVIYRGISITAVPEVTDIDGDDVRFEYRWSVNGNDLPDDSAVLGGSRFTRGDRIALAVTPYDAEGAGRPYTTRQIVIPNGPPHFLSSPVLDFQAEIYEYKAVAEDPDGDPLVYTLVSGPVGMSIDAQSGVVRLQIRKEHVGAHRVEIEVRDPAGAKDSQAYTLNLTIP